jgi:signal peptidase I
MTSKRKSHGLIIYTLIIICVAVILRVFFFETYLVSQSSMSNTLLDGDKVLVYKKGEVKRGSILVLHHNDDTFIKRCIGMPGDEIKMVKGKIYINGTECTQPAGIIPGEQGSDTNKLPGNPVNGGSAVNIMVYEQYGRYWTADDFGPYTVPAKGASIDTDSATIRLYRDVLEAELGVKTLPSSIYRTGKYTFKKNYIFVMGDNRPVSRDSRTFGVVLMENVVGSTNLVLYSKHSFFNSGRFFKKVT